MTQTLPLSLTLGSSNTGKLIGFQVLNLDRSEYVAFALATESAVAGTYYAPGGYGAPDAGGYLVVSESDGGNPAVLTPLAEVDIDPKISVTGTVSANLLQMNGATEPVDNLVLSIGSGGYIRSDVARWAGSVVENYATAAQIDAIGSGTGAALNFAAVADNTGGALK